MIEMQLTETERNTRLLEMLAEQDVRHRLLQQEALDTYKGKWKNLHFSRYGKSGLSINTYASSGAAEASLKKGLTKPLSQGYNRMSFVTLNGLDMVFEGIPEVGELHYSHTIQVPWRET